MPGPALRQARSRVACPFALVPMAESDLPWHGAEMRTWRLLLAFGLVACGTANTSDPSSPTSGVSDAGASDDKLPPAPSEPGCAMTIDGEPLPPSPGSAKLGHQGGQPALTLYCSGVEVELRRPDGPGEYEGIIRYGHVPQPEYMGYRCTIRLDRLAIKDRRGLAARVRCEVPLVRDLRGVSAKLNVRIEGYVVLPPAGPLPKGGSEPTGVGFCTYSVTGEYTLEGRGHATSSRCFDEHFGLDLGVPVASIWGTFCPTCATDYSRGECSQATNVVTGDQTVAYDISCALHHELSGELRVIAHIDGPIVLTP